MWKVYSLLFSVLLITWYVVLCIVRNHLMKATSIEVNFYDSMDMDVENGDDNSRKRNASERKIKQHIPRFMLELYENGVRAGYQDNLSIPDIVRSVIPKNAVIMDYERKYKDYKDNHLLIFDVPVTNPDEDFVGAELKILSIVDVDSSSLNGLQKLVKISTYDDKKQQIIPLQEINASYRNNTWLSFNLTNPVREVLSAKENFLKVVISIKPFLSYFAEDEDKFKLSLLPIEEDFEHDYPVLLLTYSSNKSCTNTTAISKKRKRRRRRHVIDDDYVWDDRGNIKRKKLKNTCKRKSLYVDFVDIQYDSWIVQPSGYEAYQCHGKCSYPVAEHLSPTKHAIIQALLYSIDPSKAPRSCCVPTKLGSISVLYVDSKGVLTYRYAYKDMVVAECGCRSLCWWVMGNTGKTSRAERCKKYLSKSSTEKSSKRQKKHGECGTGKESREDKCAKFLAGYGSTGGGSGSRSGSESGGGGKGKCHKPGPVTRNPFFNFLRDYRKKHCGVSVVQIARDGAKEWRNMSQQQKEQYIKSACLAPKMKRRRSRSRSRNAHGKVRKRSKRSSSKVTCSTKSSKSSRSSSECSSICSGISRKSRSIYRSPTGPSSA